MSNFFAVSAFREHGRVFSNVDALVWLQGMYPDWKFEITNEGYLKSYIRADEDDIFTMNGFKWYIKIDNAGDDDKRHVNVGRSPISDDPGEYKPASLVLATRHILRVHMKGLVIKHKNGNVFDCRKSNLVTTMDGITVVKLRDHWLLNATIAAGLPA